MGSRDHPFFNQGSLHSWSLSVTSTRQVNIPELEKGPWWEINSQLRHTDTKLFAQLTFSLCACLVSFSTY